MTDSNNQAENTSRKKQYIAVYQQAVSDVHESGTDVQEAVSTAADDHDIELSNEFRTELKWVVKLEAQKFENKDDHTLSDFYEWFDGKTVRSLKPDTS